VILLNTVAMAIWTVGVFSALYAAYLRPELRVTSSHHVPLVSRYTSRNSKLRRPTEGTQMIFPGLLIFFDHLNN